MYKLSAAALLLMTSQAERIPLVKRQLTHEQLLASKATLERQVEEGYLSQGKAKEIHLKDYMNTQYMAEVSIGTPAQKFMVIPDTGSSNVWVYDADCTSVVCLYHKTFDHAKSTTFKADTEKFVLHYGSGGVSGVQAYDTVQFGGAVAKDFHMGLIQNVDGIAFLASDMCGILGLAYNTISMYGMPTFVDASLKTKNFSFYLHSNPDESYMMMPGFDEDISKLEDYHFHNVIEERYYSLNLESFGEAKFSGIKGVIDSGTSLIVGDKASVAKILKGATVAQDCSDMDKLETLDVVIDGVSYPLTPEQYVLRITQGTETQCVMGIMGAAFPAGFDYMIIGDVFLRAYPAYFDKENNQVGFMRPAAATE